MQRRAEQDQAAGHPQAAAAASDRLYQKHSERQDRAERNGYCQNRNPTETIRLRNQSAFSGRSPYQATTKVISSR